MKHESVGDSAEYETLAKPCTAWAHVDKDREIDSLRQERDALAAALAKHQACGTCLSLKEEGKFRDAEQRKAGAVAALRQAALDFAPLSPSPIGPLHHLGMNIVCNALALRADAIESGEVKP